MFLILLVNLIVIFGESFFLFSDFIYNYFFGLWFFAVSLPHDWVWVSLYFSLLRFTVFPKFQYIPNSQNFSAFLSLNIVLSYFFTLSSYCSLLFFYIIFLKKLIGHRVDIYLFKKYFWAPTVCWTLFVSRDISINKTVIMKIM